MTEPDYLGDGVYVETDGYHIILYTSNGITRSEPIALEPPVYAALRRYARRCWQQEPGDG